MDRPLGIISLIRYRFFLYAGLLPYLLGAAWAWGRERTFHPGVFWAGLLGILFSVVGVECFNEYFDARMGTDRVFNPSDDENIPEWMLWTGIAAFALAAAMGTVLGLSAGWPVFLYMGLGGLAALFYVGPPLRFAYRGLGETMIALSYGPWMTLGSLYLQTRAFSRGALIASLVPAFLIGALAVVNEIPDFHQDTLVGKKNLVVRLGRRGGVALYLAFGAAGLAVCALGAALGALPPAAAAAGLLGLPFLILSARTAVVSFEFPRLFIPAVKYAVLCYLVGTGSLALAVVIR